VAIPIDHGGRTGANNVMKYGGKHRWCWLHEQQPNEAWIFKHYDSLSGDGHVRQCAHTSFDPPGTSDLPLRESVEFRAIVLY
jgi:hypothetical protein